MSEFLKMGGYAFYVWSSFGLTFIVMAAIVISTRMQRKRAVAMVKKQQVLHANADTQTHAHAQSR